MIYLVGYSLKNVIPATRRNSTRILRGFTLIELLIVIAIILILVAIAVPNFAAARIRAQVTRVKADMKLMANALFAYHTQYDRMVNPYYPGCHPEDPASRGKCADGFDDGRCIYVNQANPPCIPGPRGGYLLYVDSEGVTGGIGQQLTTPNKFIGEIPIDPFMTGSLSRSHTIPDRYNNARLVEAAAVYLGTFDAIVTYGPPPYNVLIDEDAFHFQSYGPDYVQDGDQRGANYIYSPTNGAKSYGDIRYYSQFGFADDLKKPR